MAYAQATYADPINGARILINDAAAPYRFSDAQMLDFLKKGILEMVNLRYDLFSVDGDITCTAARCIQQLPNARALYLIDLYEADNGGVKTSLEEGDLETLRRFNPGWRRDTAAAAETWMRFPKEEGKRNDFEFMIYPQSPAGQVLTGKWTEIPDQSAITVANFAQVTSVLPVSDDYVPALEQYITYRCETPDDENAVSQKAVDAYAKFHAGVAVAAQAQQTEA